MFKKQSNYYFSVWFDWNNILNLFDIPEENWRNFKIDNQSMCSTFNLFSIDNFWINRESAIFEYYVLPNSVRNLSYTYSTIYDQQLRRFYEMGNIHYGTILKDKEGKEFEDTISCFFSKFSRREKESEFRFIFSQGNGNSKILSFFFDDKWLNLKDSKDVWKSPISYEVTLTNINFKGRDSEEIVSVDPKILSIVTNVQSQME